MKDENLDLLWDANPEMVWKIVRNLHELKPIIDECERFMENWSMIQSLCDRCDAMEDLPEQVKFIFKKAVKWKYDQINKPHRN